MAVVIEEVPSIVIMTDNVIPKNIKEVEEIYQEMLKQGYPLDYLNVEYNLKEISSKVTEIVERTKKLDMNQSLLELKVLVEYFEYIFKDFENEK